ncbi:hypothetical protein CsSME_00017644 [Camellia sinensis var. sinensis]
MFNMIDWKSNSIDVQYYNIILNKEILILNYVSGYLREMGDELGNSTRINEQCLDSALLCNINQVSNYIYGEAEALTDDIEEETGLFLNNFMFLQEFSPDGRFIISADRDFKIRVIDDSYPLKQINY